MNLRDRLVIAWLTPLIPFVLIGMATALGLFTMTRSVEEVRSVGAQKVHLGTQAIEAFREEHALLERYAETGDTAHLDEAEKRSEFVRNRLPSLSTPDEPERFVTLLDDYESAAGFSGDPLSQRTRERKARELVQALQSRHSTLRVQLREDLTGIAGQGRRIALIIALVTALIMVLGVASSWYVSRDLTHASRQLERGTTALAAGDFEYRIELNRDDELGELAVAFNRMAQRIALLDRMKVDFFANVSHDLKTPLTSMTEAVDLLEEEVAGPLTGQQVRLVEVLKSDVRRLRGLIGGVLDMSKMDAEQVELTTGHLPEVIERVVSDNAHLAERRSVALDTAIEPHLPAVVIQQAMVEQVLTNLVSNALKFSPKGGRVLIVAEEVAPTMPAPRAVQVSVHDSGPGVPKESRSKVFERFYQVPGSGDKKGGTGLGLYICEKIVSAHGGQIYCRESRLGGAAMVFTLPVADGVV